MLHILYYWRCVLKKNQLLLEIKKDIKLKNKMFYIADYYPYEFRDAFEVYIDELILNDRSIKTIRSYYYDMKIFFDFLHHKFPQINEFSKLKTLHLTRFYSYIQRERENEYKAIARKKIVLSQFFAFLVQQGYIEEGDSPIPKEDVIKNKKKESNKKPIYLELSELKSFFNAIESNTKNDFLKYRDISIAILLFKTGLRVSELASLDISDINYAKEYGILVVLGKGDKERRIAIRKEDFNSGYLSYLDNYLELRETKAVDVDDKDALFISLKKQRLSDRQIERLVKKYKELAGIDKNITPHKFRHSATCCYIKSIAFIQ